MKNNAIIIRLLQMLFSGMLLTFFGCNNPSSIAYLIAVEEPVFNTDLDDDAIPGTMTEDDTYFYLLLSQAWRAPKTLAYPEGHQTASGDLANPNPDEDNRIVFDWQPLTSFGDTGFTGDVQLACRAIFSFNGKIYGSFSNDKLLQRGVQTYSNYNKILVLDGAGTWQKSSIPDLDISAPTLKLPGGAYAISAADIDPDTDRLFNYSEDFEAYTREVIEGLSPAERNAYEIVRHYDTNQIRLPEAVAFYEVENEFFVLYNDAYITERDESSSVAFGRNPVYRLFRVNDPELPTAQLERVSYTPEAVTRTFTVVDGEGNETQIAGFLSEKTVLTEVKRRMQDLGEPFGIARFRAMKNMLFAATPAGVTPDIDFYALGEAGEVTVTGLSSYRHVYLHDSINSLFKRSFRDTTDNVNLLFGKDGLWSLNRSLTPPLLTDETGKLPFGYTVLSATSRQPLARDTFLKRTQAQSEAAGTVDYTTYRYIDFILYHAVDEANITETHQQMAVISALRETYSDENSSNRQYAAWTYRGGSSPLTASSWTYQKIDETVSGELQIGSLETVPTSLGHFYSDHYSADGRRINRLLMGSTQGYFSSPSTPANGQSTGFSNPGIYPSDDPDTVEDESIITLPISYEHNYLTLSLSDSHVNDFYRGTAKIDRAPGATPSDIVEVNVLFGLTAGNGLWINHNRWWNRE